MVRYPFEIKRKEGDVQLLFSFYLRERSGRCKINDIDWRVIIYKSPFQSDFRLKNTEHETRNGRPRSGRKPQFGTRKLKICTSVRLFHRSQEMGRADIAPTERRPWRRKMAGPGFNNLLLRCRSDILKPKVGWPPHWCTAKPLAEWRSEAAFLCLFCVLSSIMLRSQPDICA